MGHLLVVMVALCRFDQTILMFLMKRFGTHDLKGVRNEVGLHCFVFNKCVYRIQPIHARMETWSCICLGWGNAFRSSLFAWKIVKPPNSKRKIMNKFKAPPDTDILFSTRNHAEIYDWAFSAAKDGKMALCDPTVIDEIQEVFGHLIAAKPQKEE